MYPIKHLLNSISEMKHNNHNLNQGNKFLINKHYFKSKRFNTIIEGFNNPSLSDKIAEKKAELTVVNNSINNLAGELKEKYNKKAINVKDKFGNIYYKNLDGDYYKYENSAGDNTFKPNHINFDLSCPKTAPIFEREVPYSVDKIDPISSSALSKSKCIKFQDDTMQEYYIKKLTLEREIKELKEQQRNLQTKDDNEIIYLKNLEAIKLSNKINKYNEMLEKKKNITDDINSFDTSRQEFMKSVTALQIQYGAIGITSIALIYLMVKLMANSNE